MVIAEDFMLLGGSSESTVPKKCIKFEKMALKMKQPLIHLVDTDGGSGVVKNEADWKDEAFKQIPHFLSYLPSYIYETPPLNEGTDAPARKEGRRASYDYPR